MVVECTIFNWVSPLAAFLPRLEVVAHDSHSLVGMGSTVLLKVDLRGLLSNKNAESKVNGMVMDQ